jgi:hypothetical protein
MLYSYLFTSCKIITEVEMCLTRLIADLSPHRLGFYPRTVLPGVVVDKLAITQFLLWVTQCFHVHIIPSVLDVRYLKRRRKYVFLKRKVLLINSLKNEKVYDYCLRKFCTCHAFSVLLPLIQCNIWSLWFLMIYASYALLLSMNFPRYELLTFENRASYV